MEVSPQITLHPLPASGPEASPRSLALIEGTDFSTMVSGVFLERAVACAQGWLLFITDDVPYEEKLSIHLLDRRGVLLDSAYLLVPYAMGVFTDLRLQPPDKVQFKFFNDEDIWTVVLYERPRYYLPWWSGTYGVWRSGRWKRWFGVSCERIGSQHGSKGRVGKRLIQTLPRK
jgi:hypothetical protein